MMYKYEGIDSFYNVIPEDNKEDRGDFIYSLLCFAVLKYIEKDIYSSVNAIQDVFLLANTKSAREWECIEWATFFLIYTKNISPCGNNAEIYVSIYKRKLYRYYLCNKSKFRKFYSRLTDEEITKEIKESLKRRWNKKNLDINLNAREFAKKKQ